MAPPMRFAPDRARAGLRRLARRLELLRQPVAHLETPEGVCGLLVDRGGESRAAILPMELAALPGAALERTADVLRGLAPSRETRLLVWGAPPDHATRQRLRAASVDLALYEPLDSAVLHFQVNRALAPRQAPARSAPRAPLSVPLEVRWRLRTRPVLAYAISSSGAFLLTSAPMRPGRRLTVGVPAGLLSPRARARVVMVNPPGAPARPELPTGVAVSFQGLDGPSAAVIDRLVSERLGELGV